MKISSLYHCINEIKQETPHIHWTKITVLLDTLPNECEIDTICFLNLQFFLTQTQWNPILLYNMHIYIQKDCSLHERFFQLKKGMQQVWVSI